MSHIFQFNLRQETFAQNGASFESLTGEGNVLSGLILQTPPLFPCLVLIALSAFYPFNISMSRVQNPVLFCPSHEQNYLLPLLLSHFPYITIVANVCALGF